MRIPIPGILAGLALGIAAGALPAQAGRLSEPQLKAVRAQEPGRVSRVLIQARDMAPQLGLQPGHAFATRHAFTNAEGRTVVRFDQTYAGHRIYGATGVGHVEADGTVKLQAGSLMPTAVPEGGASLTAEQATAIALKHAALKGAPFTPKVELVVFPTKLASGLRTMVDPETRQVRLDREATLVTRTTKPYVWAYRVSVFTQNRQDGITDMDYFVDGQTGVLLSKATNLRTQAAPQPAKGTGLGQYQTRPVTLDTTLEADGTYSLRDTTRGSKPNPFFQAQFGMDVTGLTAFYEIHDSWANFGYITNYLGNPDNSWGDGYPFMDTPNEGLKNGETAAVDAHFGMATTWDMYKNVFGRDGIDGQGTTPFYLVHARDGMGRKFDNAMWAGSMFGMVFGDGTYFSDKLMLDWTTGLAYPGNPYGMMSLTELSIVGHELSHGLTGATADLIYRGESGGLNEASSDILGTLAEAYSFRPEGQDAEIPNFGNTWANGAKCRPAGPLRYFDKPSKDGISADAWYEGLHWLEVHYSSGPMNRCFYYLAKGAPSNPADENHSVYLPAGMDGLGNDKAGRIYFKALTEYMTPTTDYHQAGAAMVAAATELYGAASPELLATKKALAAINVQVAGEPLFTRVNFPTNGGGLMFDYGLSNILVLPQGVSVPCSAVVTNHTDKSASWKLGGHRAIFDADPTQAGSISPDGSWNAPFRGGSFVVLSAASKARPEQFVEGLVFLQDLDADADGEQDAVDMGAVAFSWSLSYTLQPSHSIYRNWAVDDLDCDLFQTAVKNAWGAK